MSIYLTRVWVMLSEIIATRWQCLLNLKKLGTPNIFFAIMTISFACHPEKIEIWKRNERRFEEFPPSCV